MTRLYNFTHAEGTLNLLAGVIFVRFAPLCQSLPANPESAGFLRKIFQISLPAYLTAIMGALYFSHGYRTTSEMFALPS